MLDDSFDFGGPFDSNDGMDSTETNRRAGQQSIIDEVRCSAGLVEKAEKPNGDVEPPVEALRK